MIEYNESGSGVVAKWFSHALFDVGTPGPTSGSSGPSPPLAGTPLSPGVERRYRPKADAPQGGGCRARNDFRLRPGADIGAVAESNDESGYTQAC